MIPLPKNSVMITNKRSPRKSKARRRWWDAAQAVLMAGILISFSLAAPPAQAQGDDPIVEQLIAADLVTPIDHNATVNGVDVTINWAYVDASQVIVSLTMHNLDLNVVPADAIPAKENVRILTADGYEFSLMTSSATSSFVGDDLMDLTVVTQFYAQVIKTSPDGAEPWEMIDNYFTTLGPDMPETVELQVLLDITTNVTPDNWMATLPGEPAEFTLPITVTLHPGITLAPQQTVGGPWVFFIEIPPEPQP